MQEQPTKFRFQCQARSDGYAGMVLQYLSSGETDRPRREMVLTPLLAYWLPEAARDYFQQSEAEVQRSVQYALYLLELQKARLIYEFGAKPMPEPPYPSGTASLDGQAIAREEAEGDAAQGQADGAARNRAREADSTDAADPDRVRREETKRFAQEGGHDDWANRIFGG